MTSSRITLIFGFIRLLISTSTVFAQPVNNYVKDVSMPAPNAAALGKYGDYSVSNFTGVPDISIPIYTVTEGPLSLPISLSYHASGIKAAEMASWVGAGWALTCGGIITRTVQGLKDEHANGYYNTASLLQDRILNAGTNPALNGQLNEDIAESVIDGEPDIFSFNFGGYTGKFYIDQARHAQFIPKQDLKLEIDGGYEHFAIITPDGTRYIFGFTDDANTDYAQEKTRPEGISDTYTSSWYLLRVESYDRLYRINLSYVDETYSYLSAASVKWNVTVGTGTPAGGYSYASTNGDAHHKTHKMNIIGKRLVKITSSTDSINFVGTNTRQDLDGVTKSLDKIEIFTGDKCQKYDFAYTYFQDLTSAIEYSPTSSVSKKLRLESLRQTSCNNSIVNPPHIFSYNGNFLVHRLSKAIDHWGFYNGAGGNENMVDNIPPTTITASIGGLPPISHGAANRETNESEMLKGVLTQIQYPTGGTTAFTFEANTASTLAPPTNVYTLQSCSSPISNDCCGTLSNGQKLTPATYPATAEDIASGTFTLQLDKLVGTNGQSPCPNYDPAAHIYVYNGTTRVGSLSLPLNSGQTAAISDIKPLSELGITSSSVTYTFELYTTNAYVRFKIYHQPNNVLSNKIVGGLRVKEIKTSDGISTTNDIVKQYDYSISSSSNMSTLTSGRLLKTPKYGYDAGLVKINTNASNCVVGYGTVLTFNDESIVPLYTFEGNHIGYQTVTEIQAGNGRKVSKYNLNVPTIQDVNSDTYLPYPIPPYDPMVSNGKMSESHILTSSGVEVKATENSIYSETPTYSIGKIRKVIKHFFPGTTDPAAGCPGAQFWAQLYTDYRIKTLPYRLESVTETLDKVPTITTYTYSTDANQPLFPLTTSMMNSDNKMTVTTNKYVTHTDYDTDSVATIMKLFHIISNPLEVTTSVADVKISGVRIQYVFFGQSNGLPTTSGTNPFVYPHKFYKYKMTWDANGTPQALSTNNGWELEATITKYSPTKAKPEKINLRAWESATDTNATEKYTWETNGLIKTRQFKGFTWQYEYFPKTKLVSKIIDKDGQFISFFYDDLQRPIQGIARNGKVKTDYLYTFQDPAQSNRNWVETKITFGATIGGTLSNNTTYKILRQYLDGLGRLVQNVAVANSTNFKDVVSFIQYDSTGREFKKYDPYESALGTGAFVTNIPTNQPFTKMEYERSPLNRIWKTTSPNWQPSFTEFGTNGTNEIFDVTSSNSFLANTLNKTTKTDPDGRIQTMFTDKKGRKVFVMNAQNNVSGGRNMIYGFDDKDRPNKVITPRSTWHELAYENDLDYSYLYDVNDNMIQKKQPDIAAINMTYNARNQMVLMQDGNQFAANKWLATQYDPYGRPFSTGFATSTSLNAALNPTLSSTFTVTDYYATAGTSLGKIMRTRNYLCAYLESFLQYDEYGRLSNTYGNSQIYAPNGIMSPTNYSEKTALTYDLADNILTKTRTHRPNATTTRTILETMDYDNGLRLKQMKHRIDALPEQILSYSDYNVKNQLTTKKMGKIGSFNYLQKVDYAYNTLGWLTAINNPTSGTMASLTNCAFPEVNAPSTTDLDINDLFSLELKYESPNQIFAPNGTTVTPQYGGNVSQVIWQVRGREKQAYTLNYDALNRMTDAIYSDIGSNGTITGHRFDEKLTYDSRGNINTLQRWGLTSACNWGMIDDLFYNYGSIGYNISNKLNKVRDESDLTKGFKTLVNASIYTYDTNGNMTSDLNKGVTSITYNHINLPMTVTYSNGNKISWIYDAGGNKLRKTVSGTANYVQNYVGGIEYNGTTLEAIYHAEGRVTTINGSLKYEYALKDHLGNIRIMFCDKDGDGKITQATNQETSEVTQENSYYPFGLNMESVWANTPSVSDNKYQFGGKELNDDFGLGWVDFGARNYDSQIGRWLSPDPLAEMYMQCSPYNYVKNNPIRFIDPDGMALDGDFLDKNGNLVGNDGKADGKTYVIKISDKTTPAYDEATQSVVNVKTDGISKKDSKAAQDFVKTNSGDSKAFDNNSSIYDKFEELPSKAIRDQMSVIVDTDNGKGGTTPANNQEHGGQEREIRNTDGSKTGQTEIIQSPSSPVQNPATGGSISIVHTIDSRTTHLFHDHPSGTNGNSSFVQGPSVQDINGATGKNGNPMTNYQFGMSKSEGQKVYIYSTNGVKAVINKSAW